MTQPEHPSAERISDLLAGVLPATEAMDVNVHLASCEVCRDERDALLDLTALLTDEGATSLEMPSDVVASLDAAISRASTERAAGIPTIDPAQRGLGRRPASRQPLRWLAGAAAAVVVVGVGFAGLRSLPQAGGDNQADGATQPGSVPRHNSDSGIPSMVEGGGSTKAPTTRPEGINEALLSITRESQVRVAARHLSTTPSKAVPPSIEGCAVPLTDGLTSVIRFMGRPAVLTVVRATRLATVYDCATATKTIYITDY